MSIWYNEKLTLEEVRKTEKNCSLEYLGFVFTELADSSLSGTLEVNQNTIQPFGLLHGGLNCFIAETLGSTASNLCLDNKHQVSVGLSIYTDHLKAARKGFITGVTKPLHLGKSTHLWEIKTYNENNEITSITKLKTFIKDL